MKKYSGIAWLSVLLFMGLAHAAPPPISAFTRLDQIKSLSISPDGKYLAYISQAQGRRIAVTLDLSAAGGALKPVLTNDKSGNFDLSWCQWAKNTRLLCGLVAPIKELGVTYRISKLVAVNADGSEMKVLVQNSPIASGAQIQDNILDKLPSSPDSVLIQAPENFTQSGASRRSNSAVWELNIYNGRLKKVLPARDSIMNYYSDGQGNVRLGVGYVDNTYVYSARLEGKSDWHQMAKVVPFTAAGILLPQRIIAGTNHAYAIGSQGDRQGLWIIDLEDKEDPQLVFDHPNADIEGPLTDDDGALLGVFYETDRPFIYYTDDKLANVMKAVNKVLPDTFNVIASRSRDNKKIAIVARSDREAGAFYLFDAVTGQMSRLGRRFPELDAEKLPRMRTIEYAAADGTKIPGYLTVPVGMREEKLPMIVMPHGGPIARDSWDFDFLRLFLASRGYAVLQMNFRGSSGYGFKWQMAAHQDWGGLTYADIVDGTKWAIAQGIADPKRTCIVGWSFGGYAALTGAERNPDLFKCSASIAGVSDLSKLIKNQLNFVGGRFAWDQIGTDSEKLKANSPVKHADLVNMPLLMLHGTLDAQAPYEQSEDMADALKKNNKKFKFVTIENADHSLVRESERTTLLTELEEFLASQLGTGASAVNPP
jgi:dipeptidyl aminopeptidase/acylaminoacyl peptidase